MQNDQQEVGYIEVFTFERGTAVEKIVVIYKSKTGLTKQYAQWIAESLDCDLFEMKKISGEKLENYDVIIFGGGFYAGKINSLPKFKKMIASVKDKKIIVFATGATPADSKAVIRKAMRENFTDEERKKIKVFYFQSGLDYKRMGLKSRLMMKVFSLMLAKKKNKTEEEEQMAEAVKHSFIVSRKEFTESLLAYVLVYK